MMVKSVGFSAGSRAERIVALRRGRHGVEFHPAAVRSLLGLTRRDVVTVRAGGRRFSPFASWHCRSAPSLPPSFPASRVQFAPLCQYHLRDPRPRPPRPLPPAHGPGSDCPLAKRRCANDAGDRGVVVIVRLVPHLCSCSLTICMNIICKIHLRAMGDSGGGGEGTLTILLREQICP